MSRFGGGACRLITSSPKDEATFGFFNRPPARMAIRTQCAHHKELAGAVPGGELRELLAGPCWFKPI